MNRVTAAGARARRETRASERTRRGLPARRRTPGDLPSARLRAEWPSSHLRRPTTSTPRLLGAAHPRPTRPRPTPPRPDGEWRPSPPSGEKEVVTRGQRSPLADAAAPVEVATPVEPAASPPVDVPLAELFEPPPAPVVVDPSPARSEWRPSPVSGDEKVTTRREKSPLTEVVPSAPSTDAPAAASSTHEPSASPSTHEPSAAPSTDDPSARATKQRALVITATILVLVGGGVSVVNALRSKDASPAAVATAASTSAVADWLRANVAGTAPITSDDPAATADLAGRGLTVTGVDTLAAAPVGSFVVRATRSDDAPVTVTTGRTYVPVARFTAGSMPVEVGQVVATSAAEVTRNRAAALATTRSATAGLRDNPAVTVGSGAAAPFDDATLDLRAAAFLAALASAQPVQVDAAPTDPAETAVGLPVRRLVVTVGDVAALRTTVERTRAPYAPVVSTPAAGVGPAGSVLLTWSVLADPSLVVS